MTGDEETVAAINRRTNAGLTVTGRAEFGELGGAIFVDWPGGRPAVVTRFLGSLAEAERTVDILAHARDRGLPVPRHDLAVALDDGVVFVQERLSGAPAGQVTPAVVDAVVAVNDRFAGVLADRPDVPVRRLCLDRSGDPYPRHEVLSQHGPRSRRVLAEIVRLGEQEPHEMTGTDLVHIDLTMANVLFDDSGTVTGVVDWNLGAYRGDRLFALVKTRFDREWFVQSPHADPVENAATAHLDDLLAQRIAPPTLRMYWAYWALYQLHWALQFSPPDVIDWHLDLFEERLG